LFVIFPVDINSTGKFLIYRGVYSSYHQHGASSRLPVSSFPLLVKTENKDNREKHKERIKNKAKQKAKEE
jgi:hypothetical protein